jgi:hypothetical protein
LKKGTRVVVSDAAKRVKEVAARRRCESRREDDLGKAVGRQYSNAPALRRGRADAAVDAGANVTVYYRNESGQRVAKHFRRVS